ncbi:MAG TPA: prepilin-type N-terminal cleavage/methylation domain-containing protein [Oceanospirillales bacterium]|nr:prepilin-type N-terminal cleavage/methylation domain-containing protein [Oceanospirillales bacterium]
MKSSLTKKQSGFSLMEIIVAMTMLSLIMAMIYGGIHTSRKMAAKGTKRINATNEVRVVQELIRRQISRILPMAFKEEDNTFVIFEGDDEHIMYVSPMPGYLGNGGPHVQLIEIVSAKGGKILQFSHWLLNDTLDQDSFEDSDQEPVVLLENIESAEFSFVSLDEEGEPGDWESNWEEPENTPLMVRLEVDMGEKALMRWPDLQVALMLDATATNRRVSEHLLLRNSNRGVDVK